jgi:DNA invertase Pin-like site-specific DNA recombinase
VAYARVSTERQELGLEAQSAKFLAYGIAHEVQIVGIESDELSGKNDRRPGLQRALAMLEDGLADGLLVAKLDRLTRSVRDLGGLLEDYFVERFTLFSVADSIDTRSAGGRLVLNIMVTVAQWEREVIVERTKDALAHLRAKGGGTPRVGEGPALERMRALRASGLSFREVAATLTADGVATLKGGGWAGETVRRILRRTG